MLLHDVGRLYPDLGRDHHEAGALKAPEYLKKAGFKSEEISEIAHCIRAHGPRGTEEPKTLEAKVVYDVDVHSCSVGYIGVARVFDYFMREEKMGVKDMMEIPSGKKRFTTRFLYQNRKDYGYRRAKRSTKILAGIKA